MQRCQCGTGEPFGSLGDHEDGIELLEPVICISPAGPAYLDGVDLFVSCQRNELLRARLGEVAATPGNFAN